MTASAGAVRLEAAFWSQTEVSQSAANAAGSVPPFTQPKKRPLVEPRFPSSASRTSSSMTWRESMGASGKGLVNRPRSCWGEAVVATERVLTDSR